MVDMMMGKNVTIDQEWVDKEVQRAKDILVDKLFDY